jgi:hypothetical protein
MDSAACVTSNDGPAVRNSATLCGGVARKRYDRGAGLQLPHLERVVSGGGHRTLAVRGHRHGVDQVGVAGESLQRPIGYRLAMSQSLLPSWNRAITDVKRIYQHHMASALAGRRVPSPNRRSAHLAPTIARAIITTRQRIAGANLRHRIFRLNCS